MRLTYAAALSLALVACGGDNAADMLYLTGCADGSGYVFTMHYPTSDSFAAYAHRR